MANSSFGEARREPRPLVNVDGAAEYLGVSIWKVRKMVYQGEIAILKIGTRVLFDPDELDRIRAECTRPRLKDRPTPHTQTNESRQAQL